MGRRLRSRSDQRAAFHSPTVRNVTSFDLTDHVAVLTGGHRGIGLGMARGLARAGADVALWARDRARTKKAVDELNSLGAGRVEAFACDVTSEDQVRDATEQTVERFGRIDSVFANAGTTEGAAFPDIELADLEDLFRVNVNGAFLVAREATRHWMNRETPGSIVFTSSIAANRGLPTAPHYSASKGAATALARALAVRLARHHIRVNVVAPGWVTTEMTDEVRSNERMETAIRQRIPMGRWGAVDDFEGAAVFLASDASAYMTGSELVIDGGFSAT